MNMFKRLYKWTGANIIKIEIPALKRKKSGKVQQIIPPPNIYVVNEAHYEFREMNCQTTIDPDKAKALFADNKIQEANREFVQSSMEQVANELIEQGFYSFKSMQNTNGGGVDLQFQLTVLKPTFNG